MIEIYTLSTCGFCHGVVQFFKEMDADFQEISLDGRPDLRSEISKKAGGWPTVPMVFIGGKFVGGYQDVIQLQRNGKLESMVRG